MFSLDLEVVRTFVAVVDAGQFQAAASHLAVTQQAVSRRIATLEQELGARLFNRTPRGAELTIDGQAFLPHARGLLQAAERAADSVRPDRRALRVDVINPRIAGAHILREFHLANPGIELDVVTRFVDAGSAIAAVRTGAIDATFRALTDPSEQLQDDLEAIRVLNEPLQILIGPAHPLADRGATTPTELVAHKIWMPNMAEGTEWSAFYSELAATFRLTIDTIGPNFGTDAILEVIAGSSTLATFMAEEIRLVWPAGYDMRRIPIRDPTPLYPHSLVWRSDNPHPALTALRRFVGARKHKEASGETWMPRWAR